MKKTTLFQTARWALGLALGTCVALGFSVGSATAAPGGGGGATCSINTIPDPAVIAAGQSVDFQGNINGGQKTFSWNFDGGVPSDSTAQNVSVTYPIAGDYIARLTGTSSKGTCPEVTVDVTVNGGTTTTTSTTTTTTTSTTTTTEPTTTTTASTTTTTEPTTTTTTSTTTTTGSTTTTTQPPPPDIGLDIPQTDYKIMMNYELGMHCTGFEFAYCCVLPVYNSILAQVVKPNTIDPDDNSDYARLMGGDPNEGKDALGRQTVLRDLELDNNGNFKKYVLKYWHDAQPRNDGNGKTQTSTLISAVEGNSLMAWNTVFDSAALNADGTFQLSGTPVDPDDPACDPDPSVPACIKHPLYNGADGAVLGNGVTTDATDNYQNAVWNHLYFYEDLEGSNSTGTSLEADKIRLGVDGMVAYPTDCGPALHPMGPVTTGGVPNDCGGFSNGNVLTFSGEHGTVVFTQMKVLENLPIMLTSPDIWEALGLPLTPFEDSIDFFGDPGLVDEDSVRPFVAMKAQMYHYDGGNNDTPVLDSNGDPVIGFGTAPIDIPNCERCHSNSPTSPNTPNSDPAQWALVQQEYNFWMSYYPGMQTGADWYARLKSAAISMLNGHDVEHGTSFTANYPGPSTGTAQNTRLGHESVICQKCHADNVIAVVKSATSGGNLIPPITEAIHNNHKGVSEGGPISFNDSQGRTGGCQGCHPAHRSDGSMGDYPITLQGENYFANADNRDASGGCFVGRDVHSNPNKDTDGAETPAHLNPVGQWLADNVFHDGNSANGGLWCTNCHQQFGQEMWKAENVTSLVHAQPGDPGHVREAGPALGDVVSAVNTALNTSYSMDQVKSWLDPADPGVNPGFPDGGTRLSDTTHDIWKELPEPGLCAFLVDPTNPANDGNVATIEVAIPAAGHTCSTPDQVGPVDCSGVGGPIYNICGTIDGDGDFSVNAMDFCTTSDCVAAAQATLTNSAAVAVPFSAATDGRDHWLSAGEPHCADCHAAPYVEQSGNINAYPPFNYPRKASLMRYSRGHQDISCQGCHESIHGLYPVTPTTDTTSYAQAAMLNHDGSHGPLKCGTCHEVDGNGVPSHIQDLEYKGTRILDAADPYDAAVSWAHTFTAEADGLDDYCLNCHQDNRALIDTSNKTWTEHSYKGRSSREMMDKAELAVGIDPNEDPTNAVCTSCHGDRSRTLGRRGCTTKWNNHLVQGRASEAAWEYMSVTHTGTTCGW